MSPAWPGRIRQARCILARRRWWYRLAGFGRMTGPERLRCIRRSQAHCCGADSGGGGRALGVVCSGRTVGTAQDRREWRLQKRCEPANSKSRRPRECVPKKRGVACSIRGRARIAGGNLLGCDSSREGRSFFAADRRVRTEHGYAASVPIALRFPRCFFRCPPCRRPLLAKYALGTRYSDCACVARETCGG